MNPLSNQRLTSVSMAVVAALALVACGGGGRTSEEAALPAVQTAEIRTVESLNAKGWKFLLEGNTPLDNASAATALAGGGEAVTLPHTWNADDAATTDARAAYRRGVGWYRLDFENKGTAATRWLQFDGASIVTEVWLNGEKLGTHAGAFSAFRYDISQSLKPGTNTLIVRSNNSAPVTGTDPTAIAPLSGDFNMAGGLYRGVSLVGTSAPAHIALNDLGSSGVFARATDLTGITHSGNSASGAATLEVRTNLSNAAATAGAYSVRASLVDKAGVVTATNVAKADLAAGKDGSVTQTLSVAAARLWNGVNDPYLYTLVVELVDSANLVVDRSVQPFGIRKMVFDPADGFFLNGKSYPLRGVNMHQDTLGKAWAVSNADIDEKLAAVMDIGANVVRLAHYPHSDYTYAQADRLGLVIWAETAFVNQSLTGAQGRDGTVGSGDCKTTSTVPKSFVDNLVVQTQEMIRQNYNHSSIGMWSIGNEVSTQALCLGVDTVTPILTQLNQLSHTEDPSRVTVLADLSQNREANFAPQQRVGSGGLTDVIGYNRYFGWYYDVVERINNLGSHLDALHALFPKQPLSISEYGAGAAISHQTDNPLGGQINNFDLSGGTAVNYQPEGYAGFVHEQNYSQMIARPFVWGTFVWNMFDFGSGVRNEGDVRGVNTKGLVSFDHGTLKDPYFFYKANWRTDIPVVHITGRRYVNRAYPVADIKVYSNADSTSLRVNGKTIATMTAADCNQAFTSIAAARPVPNTCVFKGVALAAGNNILSASGSRDGKPVSDTVVWNLANDNAVNTHIAAGQATTGFIQASTNYRFGSDNFFSGGSGNNLTPLGFTDPNQDRTAVTGLANAGDASIWKSYRHGTSFGYDIPMANGAYTVTLGFLEPLSSTVVGARVFNVDANGVNVVAGLDVLAAAGGYRRPITRTFPVTVTNGVLKLQFAGVNSAEAVVSNITVRR